MRKPAAIRPEDSLTLAGMSDVDAQREAARFLRQAEELTAIMYQPGRNISAKAGEIERNSPLFYGTGDNPTLF